MIKLNEIFKKKKMDYFNNGFGKNILNFKRTLAGFGAVPDITVYHNLTSNSYINVYNVI